MAEIIGGRYQVVQQLGEGGFGETFLATDLLDKSQKKVVVKALKCLAEGEETAVRDLFLKEAAALARLGGKYSGIPALYAYFSQEGRYYLVYEYIEGYSLAQVSPLPPLQCLQILSSLLKTLDYIHSQGIIHRDIKPENIILRKGDNQPVLIDFGAVKETMGVSGKTGGVSTVVIGTMEFMPPEQIAGRTTYSSDLYALALTIIYALTGKNPSLLSTLPSTGELEWTPYAPPDTDVNLKRVLSRASLTEMGRRYATAREMLMDLEMSSFPQYTNNPYPPHPLATVATQGDSFSPLLWFVLTLITIFAGGTIGLVAFRQIRENNAKLAQLEREKAEMETKLAAEQKKREEETKKRELAEKMRLEAEKSRLEAVMRQKQAEIAARGQQGHWVQNLRETPETNARVGGIPGIKNIRSGPGTNYPIIGKAATGEAIRVIDSDTDIGGYLWYKIYHPASGKVGWMAAQLVDLLSPLNPDYFPQ